MTSLFSLHRKLYQWQLKKSSRYILSGLLSVSVLLLVVPMLLSTYQLYEDREDIFAILVGPEQRIAAEQLQETGFIGQMQGFNSMTGLGGGLRMNTMEQMSELWERQFQMIQDWLDGIFDGGWTDPNQIGPCFGGQDADGNCLDDFLIPDGLNKTI